MPFATLQPHMVAYWRSRFMGSGRVLAWALSALGSITVPVPSMGGRECGYPRTTPGIMDSKCWTSLMPTPANGSQRANVPPAAANTTKISVMTRDPMRVLSAALRSAPWGSWPGGRAGHEPQVRPDFRCLFNVKAGIVARSGPRRVLPDRPDPHLSLAR